MRAICFTQKSFSEFNEWRTLDKKTQDKIIRLIEEIVRDPFQGIGKPEPLKHELSGYWSRRITDEHRLVYEVKEDSIIIISCKYHY